MNTFMNIMPYINLGIALINFWIFAYGKCKLNFMLGFLNFVAFIAFYVRS